MPDPRLGAVETKLRRAEFDYLELRRKVKLAYQRPTAGQGLECFVNLVFAVTRTSDGGPVAGATVTITTIPANIFVTSGVTDASGNLTIQMTEAGEWGYLVTYPSYYNTGTSSGSTGAPCGQTITTPVILGDSVAAYGCPAIPVVLHATESLYGITFTLVYDPGLRYWVGITTYSYPGLGGCAAGATQVKMVLDAVQTNPAVDLYFLASGVCPVNTGTTWVLTDGAFRSGSMVCATNVMTIPSGSAGSAFQKFYPPSTAYTVTIRP